MSWSTNFSVRLLQAGGLGALGALLAYELRKDGVLAAHTPRWFVRHDRESTWNLACKE